MARTMQTHRAVAWLKKQKKPSKKDAPVDLTTPEQRAKRRKGYCDQEEHLQEARLASEIEGEEASASEEEADAVQNDATRQDAQPAVAPAAIPVQQEERILGSPAGALIDNTWAGLMRTVLLAQTGQTAPAGQAQAEPDDECGDMLLHMPSMDQADAALHAVSMEKWSLCIFLLHEGELHYLGNVCVPSTCTVAMLRRELCRRTAGVLWPSVQVLRVLGGDGQALQDTARPDAGPSTGREESDVRLLQYGVANGVGVTCEIQKPSPKEVQAYGTQLVMPPPAPAVAVAQQQQAQQRKGRVPPKWLLSLAPGGVRRGGSDGLAGALAKDGEGDAGARKQWSEDETLWLLDMVVRYRFTWTIIACKVHGNVTGLTDDDPQKLQMQLKDRWRTLEKTVQKGGNARGVSLSTLQHVKEIADWKEGRLNEAARIALLAAAAGQEEG